MEKQVADILTEHKFNKNGDNASVVAALVKYITMLDDQHFEGINDFHEGLSNAFSLGDHQFISKLADSNLNWHEVEHIVKKVLVSKNPNNTNYTDFYETLYLSEKCLKNITPPCGVVRVLERLKDRIESVQYIENKYTGTTISKYQYEIVPVRESDLLYVLVAEPRYAVLLEMITKFLSTKNQADLVPIVKRIPALLVVVLEDLKTHKNGGSMVDEYLFIEENMFSFVALCHVLEFDGDKFHSHFCREFANILLTVFGTHEKIVYHLQDVKTKLKDQPFMPLLCFAYGYGVNNIIQMTDVFSAVYTRDEFVKVAATPISIHFWGAEAKRHGTMLVEVIPVWIRHLVETLYYTKRIGTISDVLHEMQYDITEMHAKINGVSTMNRIELLNALYLLFGSQIGFSSLLYDFTVQILQAKSIMKTTTETFENFTDLAEKMFANKDLVMKLFGTGNRIYPEKGEIIGDIIKEIVNKLF